MMENQVYFIADNLKIFSPNTITVHNYKQTEIGMKSSF